MRLFTTLFCLAPIILANAQITIGPGDMPSAGDTLHYRTSADMDLDYAATGEDHVWDLSGLVPLDEQQDVLVPVGSTPVLYQLFFNNAFLYPDHVADHAMEGESFDLQAIQLEDVYEYFKVEADGYYNVGFGAMVNGIPTSVRRQPIDRILEFPLQFGNTDVSFSSWEIEVPGTFYLQQEQSRANEVDGWGTLYLPADTFQVLRVRSVLNRHDSVWVDQFGTGFAFDEPETVEYKWLAAGMGRPVLTVITVADVPVQVEYYYDPDDIITGITLHETDQFARIYPNPAGTHLWIDPLADLEGELLIHNAQGKLVHAARTAGRSTVIVPVGELENGMYTLQLIGNGQLHRQKFMVSH